MKFGMQVTQSTSAQIEEALHEIKKMKCYLTADSLTKIKEKWPQVRTGRKRFYLYS